MSSNTEQRLLLEAVLEALAIPHPATAGDEEAHGQVLADRVMHARIALENVLEHDDDPGWSADYLRARLAEHPPTGYVTSDQAHAALAAGKTWSEAVTPPGGEHR